MKLAKFIGYMEHPTYPRGRAPLFNLLRDLGHHPAGSTLSTTTLRKILKEKGQK